MSEQSIVASDTEFSITRILQAPVRTVWDVWTRPEHFERWFHAKPGSVELDVHPGGRWKARLEMTGGEMEMAGIYREVVDRQKLVWTLESPEEPVVMSAAFSARGGETVVVYSQNVVGGYTCEQAIEGATGILDSFERYLEQTYSQVA